MRTPADLRHRPTRVLLVETDMDRLQSHTSILGLAGYDVVPTPGIPLADDLMSADVIVTDIEFLPILQNRHLKAELIVVADDAKAGVTACLCGAADWIPVQSSADYLTEAVRNAIPLRPGRER